MLDTIEDVVARRQRNAARLRAAIGPDAHLLYQAGARALDVADLPRAAPDAGDARPRRGARARATALKCARCTTRQLHTHPAFADCRRIRCRVTEAAAARALALPMANELGDDAIARIAGLVHAGRARQPIAAAWRRRCGRCPSPRGHARRLLGELVAGLVLIRERGERRSKGLSVVADRQEVTAGLERAALRGGRDQRQT